MAQFIIEEATSPQHMQWVKHLIQDYMAELGVDLCFQGVSDELANLPWRYARPEGFILLAFTAGQLKPQGMIALKKLENENCEMKRLYVTPQYRASGLGEVLVQKLLLEAKAIGYKEIYLDTLARLVPACRLYEKLGFQITENYNQAPLEDIVYYRRAL